ncbi:MAG: 3'-5' exoribonuclease [Mycolicibacterium neoaurum]|uniref:hypothetical protein n=1 Tax=Mycolicibacterium neoaurum TaxID=1795 RepID=UPI002FF61C9C
MTVYCYDTEFLEDGHTIELISIGIVCADGREYYAVNADMPVDRILRNKWLVNNVWRHLPVRGLKTGLVGSGDNIRNEVTQDGCLDRGSIRVKPKWVIANEVRDFMLAGVDTSIPVGASMYHPELWAYFGAYDHVALAQLWGSMMQLPKGMPMYTHDLKQEMDRLGIPESAVPQPENAHNALADAQWNMAMLSVMRSEP